jgi:hypothetical protein
VETFKTLDKEQRYPMEIKRGATTIGILQEDISTMEE